MSPSALRSECQFDEATGLWLPVLRSGRLVRPVMGGAELAFVEGYRFEQDAMNNGSLTSLNAGSTINTKGAWTQLVSSTAFDAVLALIHMSSGASSTVTPDLRLVDIGIGGAGSEQVVIPNLLCSGGGMSTSNETPWRLPLALRIPAGTRIAARMQSSLVSDQKFKIGLTLLAGGFLGQAPLHSVDAYGANTGSSKGTSVTPGATPANTKGSWVQLTSATTRDHKALIVAICDETQVGGNQLLVDIGIGGAGSEGVLLPDLPARALANSSLLPTHYFLPCGVPAGTRLSARCSATATGVSAVSVMCYGVS